MANVNAYVLVWLLMWFYLPVTWTSKNLTFGLFVPWTGRWAVGKQLASAALIARDAINRDKSVLTDYHLDFVWRDSKCDAQAAVGATADLHTVVDAYIGPYCSSGCEPAGLLSAHYSKPLITYACSTKLLSNKGVYPTTARTIAYARSNPKTLLDKFALLMDQFKWKFFSIIYDTGNSWQPIGHYFNTNAYKYGLKIQKYLPYLPKNLTTETILKDVQTNARIILFLGYYSKVSRFLVSARKLNMFNGKFVFITIDFKTSNKWLGEEWMKGFDLSVFNGFLDMSVAQPENSGISYQNFSKNVRKRMSDAPFFHNMTSKEKVHKDSANLHDSIYVYAYAYNKTLQQGKDPTNVTNLMKNIFGIKLKGVSGEVLLDENGDRIPIFQLRSFQNGTPVYIYSYDPISNNVTQYPKAAILWPGGVKDPPVDSPPCGFDNERCRDDLKKKDYTNEYMIAAVFLCSLFLLAGFLIYMYYKKKKFEKDMLCEGFFVNYDEIINHSVYHGKGGSMFASRLDCNYSLPSETESTLEKLQFVARYQGHQVVIKRLSGSTLHLNRETLLDCKQARDLRHPNINSIVGVCVQAPNICILAQYCQKGSLQDILQNEDIKLDWMFKLSLASDIAIGMGELHRSPIGIHGRLNSTNCVIDNRWVCKVSDYGLDKIRLNRKEEDLTQYQQNRRLLWVAPEHILNHGQKTKPGDVYSYGIILSEILSRDDPYTELLLEPGEVVEMINDRRNPPTRPNVKSVDCDVRYKKLMQDCWEEMPHTRPNFEVIKNTMKSLHGGKQTNLVDNMISMLEKYANNLEDIVDERTQQLAAEKQKTDELLYKMLPKTIAEALKHGTEVSAVSFDSVTIFFSDIVGFTSLASMSTPLQVVDLLNDLYTCFDTIVDSHDVYKVETIGDAYMVVSGLPEKNGIKHAGEISTMSLNFLHATKSFRVRHLPDKQLQLRIGIHTGPCVAGVVGLKMPRYCLFGDTVNYASRMESSGLALKIHVSPECKELLDQLGGYKLDERGPVTMKGKGTIVTFFLEGKEGFNKSLPDLSLAASLAEHSFK